MPRLGTRLHIGAFIISPDGDVDLYTKQYLGAFPATANPHGVVPVAENTVFHPGDRNPLVRVGDRIAAIAGFLHAHLAGGVRAGF